MWYDVWEFSSVIARYIAGRSGRFTIDGKETQIMPLELRTQRDGSLRKSWYGRFEINGKRHRPNLGIKILGTPPASLSLKEEGDAAFERSRAAAQAKLDRIVEEAQTKRDSARLVEKLYEIKTGEAIKSVKLAALGEEWEKIPRRRKLDERYAAQCKSTLKRFGGGVRQANPKVEEIAQVTRMMARSFMDTEATRGITSKTWNDTLKLLRATFKYLLPAGGINPFADIPTHETETMFRKPFTPEELAAITDAAKADDFIRPIITTGMCTAMRRGDCCLLKGDDVDMKHRFITVKTAKTGVKVSIPIFPMLYDELGKHTIKPGAYVFPEQAAMYLENPDGITWRVKKILTTALGQGSEDRGWKSVALLPEVTETEARRRGLDYISGLNDERKEERMAKVFNAYMDGKKVCDVATATAVSKGAVSGYLNEIESAVKCQIVRGRSSGESITAMIKQDSGGLSAKRKDGERNASVRDFHSFRVTWVTLALTAKVPLELVQKVTGHKTTDIVLKHYFQPGREAFRQALQTAMPKLLMNGQMSSREEIQNILAKTTARTWKRDKAKIEKLLMGL